MLCFVLYLFGLLFMQALLDCMAPERDLDPIKQTEILDNFGSLAKTIVSLYMAVTGGDDWSKYYRIVSCAGWMYGWMFIFYTFVLFFALFNIVTGSLVEKAMSSNKPDRADRILNQRKVFAEQKEQFLDIFKAMDEDESGKISRSEFLKCMSNPAVLAYMASIDVAVDDVELFFNTVAHVHLSEGGDGGLQVPIERFVEMCMHLKGTATAIDMQRQLYETHLLQADLRHFQAAISRDFQHVQRLIAQLRHSPAQIIEAKVKETPVRLSL